MKNNNVINFNRRNFILKSFSSCALCCLTASNLIGSDNKEHLISTGDKHKFLFDSGMSLQDVYNFAFKEYYIPAMKNLMDQIGDEGFIELLKKSSEKLYETGDNSDTDYAERTLTEWSNRMKKGGENWRDRLTFEIIKDDENEFEIIFTECLWAKTFKESDASKIGYAGVCYQDYAMTKSFNPKLRLIREKTLMEGYDCCHFRWIMKA